jgi:hypothetical protein
LADGSPTPRGPTDLQKAPIAIGAFCFSPCVDGLKASIG